LLLFWPRGICTAIWHARSQGAADGQWTGLTNQLLRADRTAEVSTAEVAVRASRYAQSSVRRRKDG
jgi:hypothetical protein